MAQNRVKTPPKPAQTGAKGGRPLEDCAFRARVAQVLRYSSPTREQREWPWPAALARAAGSYAGEYCHAGTRNITARRASKGIGRGRPPSLARRAPMPANWGAAAALTVLAAGPLGGADEGANGFPSDPEKMIGRLMQGQDESITSVDARVPGSGCAKCAKPGANPARARANGSKSGCDIPALR